MAAPVQPDFQRFLHILHQNPDFGPEQAIIAMQEEWDAQQREGRDQGNGNGNGNGNRPPEGAQGQQPPEGDQGPAQPPAPQRPQSPPAPQPPAPKADNPLTFNPDKTVTSALPKRPSEYALKRLETFKYVPLWYFSLEGLTDAARTLRQSDAKDSLALTQDTDSGLTLRPTIAVSASKRTKYDHDLTFPEFLFAKNNFLACIERAQWPAPVIDSFNWFFYNLETHALRQGEERGERVLLNYASKVRLHWHDTPAEEHYNIASINEVLINSIARDLDARDLGKGLAHK